MIKSYRMGEPKLVTCWPLLDYGRIDLFANMIMPKAQQASTSCKMSAVGQLRANGSNGFGKGYSTVIRAVLVRNFKIIGCRMLSR